MTGKSVGRRLLPMNWRFLVLAGSLAALWAPVSASEPKEVEGSFDRFDANGDGLVTHSELARGKRFEFDRMDRNRDRVVTGAEFPKQHPLHKNEVDPFSVIDFGRLDLDGNRLLTSLEYERSVAGIVNRFDGDADNAISRAEYQEALDSIRAESN